MFRITSIVFLYLTLGQYRNEHSGLNLLNSRQTNKRKQRNWVVISTIAIVLIVASVGIALGVSLSKKGSATRSSGVSGGSGSPNPTKTAPGSSSTSGTSGSIVTLEDGTQFTYQNNFGGDWAFDPKNPFGSGGKAQSWSPRVGSEQWQWGTDIIRGVNLG